jgi:hypothetical protein
MVRLHRVSRANPGTFPAAAQWAKEVAGYLNANFSATNVTVYEELFGEVGTLHRTQTWKTWLRWIA